MRRNKPQDWELVVANPLTPNEADELVRAALPALRRLLEAHQRQAEYPSRGTRACVSGEPFASPRMYEKEAVT